MSRPTEGLVGCSVSDKASVNAVAQSSLHLRRGLQGAEHVNGGDRFSCELGRYVSCNDSQSEDLDVNRLTNPVRSLQVLSTVLTHSEVEVAPRYGLFDRIVLAIELVSDGCADEVGAV